MDNKFPKRSYALDLAASLVALVLILALMYISQGVLLPLLFATLISISLFPLARFFEKMRLGKALSALLSVTVAIAIISAVLWFIVHQSIIIGKNATAITDKVLSVLEEGQRWLDERFGIGRNQVMEKLREQGNKSLENVGGMITSTFGSIGNMLASAILVPLYSLKPSRSAKSMKSSTKYMTSYKVIWSA
jgi:predicted PurR-regulated permease PerM